MSLGEFFEERDSMISILSNAVIALQNLEPEGGSPFARMVAETKADAAMREILGNLGAALSQEPNASWILEEMVQAVEILRGKRAESVALRTEDEINAHYTGYDPRHKGLALRINLPKVMEREREEKRSNPFWGWNVY